MKTEIIKKRQLELLARLKEFIKTTGHRPTDKDKFRGLKTITDLKRSPEKILISELKELIFSNKYSGGSKRSNSLVKEKVEKVLIFIEQNDRIPETNTKDKNEKYLRNECLSNIKVRSDKRIREKLKYYFISKLLSVDDCCEACYQFIKKENRWPRQISGTKEGKMHYYLKLHLEDFNARYPEFQKLVLLSRPTKNRKNKSGFDHVSFYKNWCELHGTCPKWSLRNEEDFTKAQMLKNNAYASSDKTYSNYRLTDTEKIAIREISESYGYVFVSRKRKQKENKKEQKETSLKEENKEIKTKNRVYQAYLNCWDGIKTNSQIINSLALQFGVSVDVIKRYVQIGKKDDMSYNENHIQLKNKFNRDIINFIGRQNISSILDPFAGEKSFYLDKERVHEPINILTTKVITNDIKFKGHTFNTDARNVLDYFVKIRETFDIVDLDPFDQPLYYISLINLINMTNKVFLLTLGCMDRTKTTKAIRGIWDIQFLQNVDPIKQIEQKISEVAEKYCGKIVRLLKVHRYQGGTYRLAFIVEKEEKI